MSLLVFAVAAVLQIQEAEVLVRFQETVFDSYQRRSPRPYDQQSPVRILDIDEASVKDDAYGQWPWPRSQLATVVDRLHDLGAKVIVFDVFFPEEDRSTPKRALEPYLDEPGVAEVVERLPDHDLQFAESLERATVVTAFLLNQEIDTEPLSRGPWNVLKKGRDIRLPRFAFSGATQTLEDLKKVAKGNGAVNSVPDADGVVRRVPLLLRLGDTMVPSLAAEALRVARSDDPSYWVSGGLAGIDEVRIGPFPLVTDRDASLWLHYSEDVDERKISAARLLNGDVAREEVEDAVVFVGGSAAGLFDRRRNPLGEVVAGVSIHAQAVEQMLDGSYLRRPHSTKLLELLAGLSICVALVVVTLRFGALGSALLAFVTILGSVLLSWLAFDRWRLLLDPVFPSLIAIGIFGVCSVTKHLRTERDKHWIHQAFATYISPNLVDYLIEHPEELRLRGERRECSFVFTDLAGFTSLVERTPPDQVVALVDEYLEGMIEIALRHEGTLDRVVGDGVAVMFSAPRPQPDHRDRALACALEMDEFSRSFQDGKRRQEVEVGRTRIGVNTGLVAIGNFGGGPMVDYRALGDAVNTTSRLESANRHLGTWICVSAATVDGCGDFTGRPIGDLVLKGKKEAIGAFEPLRPAQAQSPATAAYLEAFRLLAASDPRALEAFESLVGDHPEDPLARFHLDRLRRGETGVRVVLERK